MKTMTREIDAYLRLRRGMGFKLVNARRDLTHFRPCRIIDPPRGGLS